MRLTNPPALAGQRILRVPGAGTWAPLLVVMGAACGTSDDPGNPGDDASNLDAGRFWVADAAGDGSSRARDAGAGTPWMGRDALVEPEAATRAGHDANGPTTPSDAGTSAPPQQPTGYASTPANGLATTSGGGAARPNIATSCTQLKSWLEDETARVVEVPEGMTLDCRTSPSTIQACELKCESGSSEVFWRVPVGDQTCTSLADFNGDGVLEVPAGTLVNKQRTDFAIRVKSNKTLRGAGPGATLLGVSLNIDAQSNIIVRNIALREVNPSLIEAGDGVTMNGAHHVWIDHCAFSMISDGYMDIRAGSRAITVSYNHIDGANRFVCGGQHNFVSLVSDAAVTIDHNYFDHVGGRNPKVTGDSQVHLYSNYYEGVSYFCANAGEGSELLVEGNHYTDSRYPHWAEGGAIEASGNHYAGSTSTTGRDDNAELPSPPYEYALEDAASLGMTLPARVGPQ